MDLWVYAVYDLMTPQFDRPACDTYTNDNNLLITGPGQATMSMGQENRRDETHLRIFELPGYNLPGTHSTLSFRFHWQDHQKQVRFHRRQFTDAGLSRAYAMRIGRGCRLFVCLESSANNLNQRPPTTLNQTCPSEPVPAYRSLQSDMSAPALVSEVLEQIEKLDPSGVEYQLLLRELLDHQDLVEPRVQGLDRPRLEAFVELLDKVGQADTDIRQA